MREETIFAALIGFCIGLFGVGVLTAADLDWNGGDAPTWLSAITTFGALVAAAKILQIERQRDGEDKRDRAERREEDERRAQADLVAAWYSGGSAITLRNSSTLPIYAVDCEVIMSGTRFQADRIFVLGPDEETLNLSLFDGFDYAHDELGRSYGPEVADDSLASLGVEIAFRDAGGRSWSRQADGRLRRL